MRFFEIAAPNCIADDFNGEIVALNLNTGVYFSLRELAAEIWSDLAAGHSVEALLNAGAGYEKFIEDELENFVARLVESGLMRPLNEIDRQVDLEMRLVSALDQGKFQILIDAYSDMQDLVMTDPVHDVDEEIGWPVVKSDGLA